jgi:hypothetical protein
VSGKILEQFPEMAADVIASLVALGAGGDGTARPDPASLIAAITNNFTSPSGATPVLTLVSSSQAPTVFS